MNAIIALISVIGFYSLALYFKVEHDFSDNAFISLLAFGLAASLVIAFYDRITKVKFMDAVVELAKADIDKATQDGIAALKKEVARLKTGKPVHVIRKDGYADTEMRYKDDDG